MLKRIFTREIIAYLIVGVLTTIVGLTVYYALTFTVLDTSNPLQLQIANIIMWIVAVTFAYIANRIWVFNSKDTKILSEATKFYGARVVTLLMDMALMAIFVSWLGFDDRLIKLITQVIVIVGNYVFSKFWVFSRG